MSDYDDFAETRNALMTLGFSNTEQEDMFKVWSAVLHLGNVKCVFYLKKYYRTKLVLSKYF